ncbi:MAG: S49 family peptidase [Planctomycetota bacterium]
MMKSLFAGAAFGLVGVSSIIALPALGQATVGYIELEDSPIERPGPFDWLSSGGASPTLLDVVSAFERAAEDDSLDAVVVRLKGAGIARYQIEEIGRAMEKVRASGKKIHIFSESYGMGDLLLASHADDVLAQAGGPVSLPGLYAESMFYRDMFDWVGITPDFVQIGDYKGANESYMNDRPSDAWEENISQLLDSVYEQMRGTLKDGRGMNDRSLDRAMEEAWYTDAEHAEELGLIDSAIDLDDLGSYVEDAYGSGVRWNKDLLQTSGGLDIDTGNPFAVFGLLTAKPDFGPDGPAIAVVHIDGPIMDGESSPGGLFGSPTVGSRSIRRIINDIAEEDDIGGVIVRINSPGGSATASEVIWRGFQRLSETKPVWVSVGSLAASGGYYIAVSGDKIYVNDSSVVGSIGVVGGKLAMGGVYDKLRLNVVQRSRGPRAGMFGSVEPWTLDERRAVRSAMEETYEQFTDRVTTGRPDIDLSRTAEGRLFTGDKAVDLAMADKIGSLEVAIDDLASEIGFGEFEVLHYPGPQDFETLLEQAFGVANAPSITSGVRAGVLGTALETLSPELRASVMQTIDAAVMLRNEPVMLLDVNPIVIR